MTIDLKEARRLAWNLAELHNYFQHRQEELIGPFAVVFESRKPNPTDPYALTELVIDDRYILQPGNSILIAANLIRDLCDEVENRRGLINRMRELQRVAPFIPMPFADYFDYDYIPRPCQHCGEVIYRGRCPKCYGNLDAPEKKP